MVKFLQNKIVVTLRDPVKRFASFLNYRQHGQHPRSDWTSMSLPWRQNISILVDAMTDTNMLHFHPYYLLYVTSKYDFEVMQMWTMILVRFHSGKFFIEMTNVETEYLGLKEVLSKHDQRVWLEINRFGISQYLLQMVQLVLEYDGIHLHSY